MWPLTLRKEQKFRVQENKVKRRIHGPKAEKVTGGWRKLHSEEIQNLYSSAHIVTVIKTRIG
jgi:hypothetical protein